jgi:type VI secretion system protein ImpM
MGDFLRIGTPTRAGDALEKWVDQGFARAESRVGASWPAAYANGSAHAFVFRAPRSASARETVVGVIAPSTDAVGRRFPLVMYGTAPIEGGHFPWPHVLPLVLGEFFDAAAATLRRAATLSSTADLIELLRPLAAPELARSEAEARDYAGWSSEASLNRAWGVLYGHAGAMLATRAIHVIADALAPFRGEAAPATTLGLRLPLGSGGVAAAAFWLDAVRRLAGLPNEVRTSFWSSDGTRGSVIVQIGDTPPSTLAELWSPDADSESLCDLTAAPNVDVGRLLSGLPHPLADALKAPDTLVCDFLDRLT